MGLSTFRQNQIPWCKFQSVAIFRIHGDNIIECERMIALALRHTTILDDKWSLTSIACPKYEVKCKYGDQIHEFVFELFPGFNKNTRKRWSSNVFTIIHETGSYLDETPDAVLTKKIDDEHEQILVAIEFCSALQAGNQAWQRSGRAFSTGRTGCPYLYIVDFVKYELDSETRKRKALRFPNPAVPFSYIMYSRRINSFVVQAYVKSEEFQKDTDDDLSTFDESWFTEEDISDYLMLKMLDKDTSTIETRLLNKNFKVVEYLAKITSGLKFNESDWNVVHGGEIDLIDYCIGTKKLKCGKKIAEKSSTGSTTEFNNLVKKYGVGLTSSDLPYGVISGANRNKFVEELCKLYPSLKDKFKKLRGTQNLTVCLIKGFKPRGDDNRPDRGVLPMVAMLTTIDEDVLTFIYGPLIKSNKDLLESNPYNLSRSNGLWRSILSLSNFVLVDSPVIDEDCQFTILLNNNSLKYQYNQPVERGELILDNISPNPVNCREDDVDTIIHQLFTHILVDNSFECMCNPPGGDWSGISVKYNNIEYRWLSLPRAPDNKRPDHVIELWGINDKPILLSIESKDTREALHSEGGVGPSLKNYLEWLFKFAPSVENDTEQWKISSQHLSIDEFIQVTAVAYISDDANNPDAVFKSCGTDLVITLHPLNLSQWGLRLFSNSMQGKTLKDWIIKKVQSSKVNYIKLLQ